MTSEDPCTCCGGTDTRAAETEGIENRWIAEPSVLDAELPDDLQAGLCRFLGTKSVETLGDWVVEVRTHTGGGAISVEELCLSDEETDHWGIVDGEKHHFACFYDAVILAAVVDRSLEIRTKSPEGAVIEARATGTTDLTVTPQEAVFSFGIDRRIEPPGFEGPSLEDGHAAICPYVKAFPDPAAYERWATTVPAATVAMPLAGATELAAELVK